MTKRTPASPEKVSHDALPPVLASAFLAVAAVVAITPPTEPSAGWPLLLEIASGVLEVLVVVLGYLYYRSGGQGAAVLVAMAYLSPTMAATFLMVIAPLLLLVGDVDDVRIFSGLTGALVFSMLMTVGSAFARQPRRPGQRSLVGMTVGVTLLSAAGAAGIMDLLVPRVSRVADIWFSAPFVASVVAGTGSAAVCALCWRAGGRLNRRISASQAVAAAGEFSVLLGRVIGQVALVSRVSRLLAMVLLLYAIFREGGDVLDEQKALARESHAYRVAFDSVPIGVCSIGRHGRVETFNRMFQRVFGVAEDEVVGRRAEEVLSRLLPQHAAIDPRADMQGMLTGDITLRIDGQERLMSGASYPLVSDEGPAGIAMIARDVTEQRRLEEELRQSERLRIAGSVANTMSSRLSVPLDRIKRALVSCLATAEGAGLEYLRLALRELERLDALMQDLRFLQAPAGLELQPVSLGEIAQQVVEVHRAAISRKGVVVSIRLAPDDAAVGDRRRLQQVVTNVVRNALEAVEPGGSIDVETWVDRARGLVGLNVRNSGSSIRNEDLERVFEPFFSTKPSGTGLGLTVCRRIVEDHGGRVSIANEATGVVCSIELPACRPVH